MLTQQISVPTDEWGELLCSLMLDLRPLGHKVRKIDNHNYSFESEGDEKRAGQKFFWQPLHQSRHHVLLRQEIEWIRAFEESYQDIFCDMGNFEPSSVDPTLEIVDFKKTEHKDIINYLRLSQSSTSRKLVGRRMGLLIWDDGQTARRPLIGGAVLSSPMFSQPVRDSYLNWPKSLAKKHKRYDAKARHIREAGLLRMMQLSIACALPPYQRLRGAKLAALAPFTELGRLAFERACKNDADDLAAIITFSAQDVTGTPFQNHRIGQLSGQKFRSAQDAKGNVYHRIRASSSVPPLRARFFELLSEETKANAVTLFLENCPKLHARVKSPEVSALRYAIRRLGLPRDLVDGNEMGVHIGMLGEETADFLRTGEARPARQRHNLDWERCVSVWTRGFMPVLAGHGDPAQRNTIEARNAARRKRANEARSTSQRECYISSLV